MQFILSVFVVVSMLGQTVLGILPPDIRLVPLSMPEHSEPAIPVLQGQTDPCLAIAYATYLPVVMRGSGSTGDAVAVTSSANASGLKGRILDANDAANGIETPLVGATVCSLETGLSVITDVNGEFTLTGLPAGASHVQYLGDTARPYNTYASYRSKIELVDSTTKVIDRPIYLMKKDAGGGVQIDPNQTTTLVNANLGIQMTIPPHTVKDDSGQEFSGIMSVSEVPARFTPGSLPDMLEPGFVVTIQPMGLTFAQPVPITFPNTDNLPPGSEVDFWSMDHATATFFVAGTGRVSSDGTKIQTIRGGVREASWHFPMPPWSEGSNPDDGPHPNNTPAMCMVSSDVAPHSGNLKTGIRLPAYISMGDIRSLNFVYSTERAYPYQLYPIETTIPRRAAVPPKISAGITVSGTSFEPVFINTSGLNESIDETIRASIPIDLTGYETGVYPSTMRLTSHYSLSKVSSTLGKQMVVVNEQASPFGAGWGMAGLSELTRNADGSILVSDGDGSSQLFSESALDLSTWTQEGTLDNGNWVVAQDGASVVQTINGNPTFFVSPDNHINTTLRGKIRVETANDDDFIGFVFGYRSPFAANGDVVNDFEFLLFDWKQFGQSGGQEGFSLAQVNGVIADTGDSVALSGFWKHQDSPGFRILATNYGSDKGWADNTEYDFSLLYETGRIKITINNETIFDVLGDFPEGRFGFYNLSQDQVRYSNFTSSRVTTVFKGPPGDPSTLTKNSDGTFTRRFKNGTQVHFNGAGLQTAVVDRTGNTTRYAYDGQNRLTAITDPAGQVTTLAYAGGLLSSVTLPDGRVTTFSHSGSDLTGVSFPDNSSQVFGYDSRHLMISETDRRGQVRTRQFDRYGRITQAGLPDGSTRATLASQKVGLIDPAGGVGTETNPAPVERPSSVWSELTDGEGRLRKFTAGPVSSFASVTDEAGLVTTYTRDQDGNATRITRPTSAAYNQSYDSRGNLTSFSDVKLGGTTSFTYDSTFNQVTSIVDPFLKVTNFSYDAAGNLTQLTTPLNRTATFEYDNRGLVTMAVDPLGTAATFGYNGSGNLIQMTQGSGAAQRTARLSYTPQGYVDILTDPLGRVFDTNYDSLGRPVSENLPGGRTVNYGYDSAGNLISLVPPGKPAHTFGYNAVGQLSAYSAPPVTGGGTNQTLYTYNQAQQPTQIVRPDGQALAIAYDGAGRPTTLTIPRGQLVYGYSGATGQLTSLAAPDGVNLGYSYNGDLLTRVTWSGPIGGYVSYAYDKKGRVIQTTLNNNQSGFRTLYNDDDQIRQAGNLYLNHNAQSGLLETITLYNFSDSRSYNQFAELSGYSAAVSGSPLYAAQYGRDALGRIITKTETITAVTTAYVYSYDPAGRLTAVQTNGAVTEQYSYDLNGNRLTALGGAAATYDNQDRLLTYGGNSYSYTANGELLTKTSGGNVTSYNYDALGNLMGVTLPGSTQITYLVDGENRRIGKQVNGALQRRWLYMDSLNPVSELDGAGNLVSSFIYGSQSHVPDYMVRGGQNYRLISDHLGSVRLVVNASTGAVAQRLDYDAFGRVLLDTNPGFQPFGFAGGLYDSDTGLVRFGARDFDAEVGRWTAKDPIGFWGGSANLYTYVLNNAMNLVDPNGLGYWGKRPIDGFDNTWNGGLDNWLNTEGSHEHYFSQHYFNDGYPGEPFNSGLGPDGVFQETGIDGYDIDYANWFDDEIMQEAMGNTPPLPYSFLPDNPCTENCQEWADRVRDEYYRTVCRRYPNLACNSKSPPMPICVNGQSGIID